MGSTNPEIRRWCVTHTHTGCVRVVCWARLQRELSAWVARHCRPPIEADDIASETILRGWRQFGRQPAEPVGRVWTWCRTTARHLIVDEVRRALRCVLAADAELLRLAAVAPLAQSNSLAIRAVEVLVGQSNPTERRVIELLRCGATTAEMAATVGVTVRTIERHRQALRRRLEQQFAAGLSVPSV